MEIHRRANIKKEYVALTYSFLGSPWGNRTPLSRMKILRPNR